MPINAVSRMVGETNNRIWQVIECHVKKSREKLVGPLIAALWDRNLNVRGFAAIALGYIGDPRAIEPLIAVLRDEQHPCVREAMAEAVGKIKGSN